MNNKTDERPKIEKHKGEFLEHLVRKIPYPIKLLSKNLGISRTTLYNKFKSSQLDYDFLVQVSKILHLDLQDKVSQRYPQVILPDNPYHQQNIVINKKYIQLLEGYQRLFGFLVKITHKYGLENTRNQLDRAY